MELNSFAEARNTRKKLQHLEQLHEERSLAPAKNPFARELTLKSLRMMIKQLKEELARFEARVCQPKPEVERPEAVTPVRQTETG